MYVYDDDAITKNVLVEEVTKAYENACKKQPKSEDLLLGLFHSYTRRGEYQKQKEVTKYSLPCHRFVIF
jgi:hypothetical protein